MAPYALALTEKERGPEEGVALSSSKDFLTGSSKRCRFQREILCAVYLNLFRETMDQPNERNDPAPDHFTGKKESNP
jgi:hypothetical protein